MYFRTCLGTCPLTKEISRMLLIFHIRQLALIPIFGGFPLGQEHINQSIDGCGMIRNPWIS